MHTKWATASIGSKTYSRSLSWRGRSHQPHRRFWGTPSPPGESILAGNLTMARLNWLQFQVVSTEQIYFLILCPLPRSAAGSRGADPVHDQLENSRTDHEDEQQRQEHVGGIGVDMHDMHPPDDGREFAQDRYRRLQDETIDDVDFSVFTFDRSAEVLSDGLRAFFAGGRTEHGIEDNANRIGESSCGVRDLRPEVAQAAIPDRAASKRPTSGQQSEGDEAQREYAGKRDQHVGR